LDGQLVKALQFATRQADLRDLDAIAEAHLDSIRSIGPRCYPPEVVDAWSDGVTGDLYARAMARGEVFFIAVGEMDGKAAVLGFSSDYRIEGSTHGMSVYVRGAAARRGIGTALIRLAENHAVAAGGTSIQVDASLTGEAFYRAHGFVEIARGETRLMSGRPIACVFMRKTLIPA
jgi:putative acetyltransferase